MIAQNYLKRWFTVDFLSCVPISYILLITGGNSSFRHLKMTRVLRLLRIAKMLRLAHLKAVIDRYEEELVPIMQSLASLKAVVLTLFISHITACAWYFIGDRRVLVGDDVDQIFDPNWTDGFIVQHDDPSRNITADSIASKYIVSMYWALTTLTTVGYGDILPITEGERIFTLCMQIVGTIVMAYMTAVLSSIIMSSRVSEQEYTRKMESISEYLRMKRVNLELRKRIRAYFDDLFEHKTALDEAEVLALMPPPMARAVVKEVYQHIVADMLLFKDLDEEIITSICLKLRPYKAQEGEIIQEEGGLGTELYIVHIGYCTVASGGVDLGTLAAGAFFGETSVLGAGGGAKGRMHTRTVTAGCLCRLSFLTRETILEMGEKYPDLSDKLTKFTQRRKWKDAEMVTTLGL